MTIFRWIFLFLFGIFCKSHFVNAQIVFSQEDLFAKNINSNVCLDTSNVFNSDLKAGEVYYRNPRIINSGSKNLIPNASFELGTDGWSSTGIPTGWGGDLWDLFGEIDTLVSWEGKRSFRIDLGPDKTEITYFDVWPMVRQAQTAPNLANRGWIDVTKGSRYTLSAYMRSDQAGIPAILSVYQSADLASQYRIDKQGTYITLSTEWVRYSFTITAADKQLFIAVGPMLVNENDSATIWIDAIQFEQNTGPTDFQLHSPFEVGLSTGKFGNIFTTSENVNFKLTSSNQSSNEIIAAVQCNITDYFDSNVFHDEKQIIVGTDNELELNWPLGISNTGYYNVKFSWTFENKTYTRNFPISIIAPYLWEDSYFGINHSPTETAASKAIQLAGLKWNRDWSMNWGMLEPQEGNLSFIDADEQILNSEKLGFKTLCLLPPLPSTNWNSVAPESVSSNLWYRMAYMPNDTSKLMNFITASIGHFKDKVKHWEFLNEPIWTSFCLPGASYNLPDANYIPADYIALLKKAYIIMKSADPSCNVIGGFSAEPWRFTKEFILADGLKYIDILNIHNYGGFTPPESFIDEMDELLSQMDQYGGRKPIWITEYSYYGADSLPWSPWKAPENHWSANLLLESERQCADWTIRYNTIMFARGVEKIIYHEATEGLINDGSPNLEFAMLGEEGVPRKLYAAQAAMANFLGPEFTYAGQLENNMPSENSTTHKIQAYSFQSNEKAVLIAWISEKEYSNVLLNVPDGVDVYNIMGAKTSLSGEIKLSISPVYIVSNSLSASDLLNSCSITIWAMGNEEKQIDNSFNVFPNPSNGIFKIEINNSDNQSIKIFDLYGKLIHNDLIAKNTTEIDLTSYPTGLYFLQLTDGRKKDTKKLMLSSTWNIR
jgi:Secretion system C-terminal sorting domain/Glycosyl hydrolase catalytic core